MSLSKNPHVFRVVSSAPVPRISGRGRKLGKGKNLDMLNAMQPGESIWEVPRNKMLSIKFTAWKNKIAIQVRRLPSSSRYAIFKVG